MMATKVEIMFSKLKVVRERQMLQGASSWHSRKNSEGQRPNNDKKGRNGELVK